MGLFSPNSAKLKQIELQNILFDTNEKKLMVSVDFLHKMTTSYVSKRMKNINKMTDVIVVTKNPHKFFAYCESIDKDLEELIRLEPYHNFKQPIPSEFKKIFEAQMGQHIESMIKRTWKDICQKVGVDHEGKREPKHYGPVLDALLAHKDKYSPTHLELIDKFYKSVYGTSFIEPEEPEIPETEETAEGDVPEDELVLNMEETDMEEALAFAEETEE